MKIGHIAKAAGVTTSRIRFYEKHGIIAPADRQENGYRDYPPSLVEYLQFIEQAQKLGFTLKEIKSVEPTANGHPVSCAFAIDQLTKKIIKIDQMIDDAQQLKKDIQVMIEQLSKS